jgi:hypothetical protein
VLAISTVCGLLLIGRSSKKSLDQWSEPKLFSVLKAKTTGLGLLGFCSAAAAFLLHLQLVLCFVKINFFGDQNDGKKRKVFN